MHRLLRLGAALSLLTPQAAFAQPTQTGVLGPSDNPVYSEIVQGSDGVVYICKPDIKTVEGQPVRECLRAEDEEGSVFGSGNVADLGVAPAIAAGVVGLALIAGDSGAGTTTTTTAAD